VAKAESGRLHVDPAQVDLPAVFGRLRGMARPMAEGKPVEVIVSADGPPEEILIDEVALTSILRNLLSNGIKYTDHGEVRLSAQVTGPRLEISVADTGIGIPAGLHEHVFEEFYQVPGVRRGGTGLGLPYARRLARILGGNLTLTSAPGAGTTAVLDLPLRTPALGTVLLADDDAAFRGVLRGLLAGLAGQVLEALLRKDELTMERLERVMARVLGDGPMARASAAVRLSREEWLRLVPDSTLRCDICAAAVRPKPGRPPVAMAVDRAGVPGDEELQVMRQLVQMVALAVDALRSYAEEHTIALTLQRSLLPPALPEVPGLAIAVRYIPASDQAEVGGDFYEALRWRDKVLVAIGDVQGHSLHAATVMGELRHALRAFAIEGHSPLAITGLVNEVLTGYHPGIIATLCLALLDPASGEAEIVNCGHMAPLLVAGGNAAYVGEGGLLLGLPMHEPHLEKTFLPPEGTLLLMTDGLVEDRDVFLDVNLEKLRVAALEVGGADVEAFINHLMAIFGPREDDVAMIALRRTGTWGRTQT
jgi:hypothetical protein